MSFTPDNDVEVTSTPRKDGSAPRQVRSPPADAGKAIVKDDGDTEVTITNPEAPYEGKEGWERIEGGEVYIRPKDGPSTDAPGAPSARKVPSAPLPEGMPLFSSGKSQADMGTEVYTNSRREHVPASRESQNNSYGVMESSGRSPLGGARAPSSGAVSGSRPSSPSPDASAASAATAGGYIVSGSATGSATGPSSANGAAGPNMSGSPGRSDGHVVRGAPRSDDTTLVYVSGQKSPVGSPNGPPARSHAQGAPSVRPGPLKILLVGSGGREHAMAAAIRRSPGAELFVVPRHRNPGMVKLATGFRLVPETETKPIVEWARAQKIDVAVVGPESGLEAGLVDALQAAGIACASPTRAAAMIETDKSFMRELMARHNVPGRLGHQTFRDVESACAFLDRHGPVWALKPIGLTGGKGVQVHGDHFTTVEEAKACARTVFSSKEGGGALQVEELARGEEFTLMAFTDGTHVVPMPAVQDHKRLKDGDMGPNTGGMGSYTQADGLLPFLAGPDYEESVRIVQALVDALRADGTPFVGTIYGQFMLTAQGPKVIEVNARFGDPEAINVLHLLATPYAEILRAMATGTLDQGMVRFRPRATVARYVVPRGYGEAAPAAGRHIEVDEFNIRRAGGTCYYAHVEQSPGGPFLTMRSRTLAILGEGNSIAEAEQACTKALAHVHGEALFARMDIGTATLLDKRVRHMQSLRAGLAQAKVF